MSKPTSPGTADGSWPDPSEFQSLAELTAGLDRLRRAAARGRGQTRFSLTELAAQTGIPRSTVHAYLSGRHQLPPDALDAILRVLGVAGADLGRWANALDRITDQAFGTALDDGRERPSVPRQLPTALGGFVGRHDELTHLDELLDRERTQGVPPVIAVAGPGGIGKSALVAHWAHRRVEHFPDGQIWLDLHGFGVGKPMPPSIALGRLIRSVRGPGGALPGDLDSRVELFRTEMAERRLLLVLDNARASDQVLPLIPGSSNCTVIVTSRGDLRTLAVTVGAQRLRLSRLLTNEAVEVLTGGVRSINDAAVARLAARCDGLPLALRIVRERLSGRGADAAAQLATELDDMHKRLGLLEIHEAGTSIGVRAVLEASVAAVSDQAARLLTLLALIPGAGVDLAVAATVSDQSEAATRRNLEELTAASLLDPTPRAGQYVRHDLVASFAHSQLDKLEPGDIDTANLRMIRYLRHGFETVCDYLNLDFPFIEAPAAEQPVTFTNRESALQWAVAALELVSAPLERGLTTGHEPEVWSLIERAFWANLYRGDTTVLAPGTVKAADAAARLGRRLEERKMRNIVGINASTVGDNEAAIIAFGRVVDLSDDLGARENGLINAAQALLFAGRAAEAISLIEQNPIDPADDSLTLSFGRAAIFADAYRMLGDFDEAERATRHYISDCQATGSLRDEVAATSTLAWIDHDRGEYERAIRRADEVEVQARELVDDQTVLEVLTLRLSALCRLGRWTRAATELSAAQRAVRSSQLVSHPVEIDLLICHAQIEAAAGNHDRARQIAQDAIGRSHRMKLHWQEASNRLVLAQLEWAADRRELSRVEAELAAELADRFGYRSIGRDSRNLLRRITKSMPTVRTVKAR